MKNDRFFTAILIGIGVIILIAFGAFFLRNSRVEYIAEDTPSGVVNNYVLALYQQDYQKAYGYLADLELRPTFEQFQQAFLSNSLNLGNISLKIDSESIVQNNATVFLTMTHTNTGPFSEPFRETQNAALRLQNGVWKISNLPYPFWNWDWYQTNLEKTQP